MEIRNNTKHFTHLMCSGFLKVMNEFTGVWFSGLLCAFVCMCICTNLSGGPAASISHHLSALQLESVDVCRMYIQNYDVVPVCHSLNTSRHYFPGRYDSTWKKDELCHMVNRSNTLLINTVLQWYETGNSYGGTSLCFIYFKTRDVVCDAEKKIIPSQYYMQKSTCVVHILY